MLIDMHVHTRFSPCSIIRISQIAERIREAGIDGICITDHDTVGSKYQTERMTVHADICVIVGLEYTTPQGDFLVYGPVEDIPLEMDAEKLLRWVHKECGVAIPAHPFRKSRPADRGILSSCEIVEVLNGRNQQSENELCAEWIVKHGNGKRATGGSDAHTLQEIGQTVTVFKRDIYSAEDLIRELRSGQYSPHHMHLSKTCQL